MIYQSIVTVANRWESNSLSHHDVAEFYYLSICYEGETYAYFPLDFFDHQQHIAILKYRKHRDISKQLINTFIYSFNALHKCNAVFGMYAVMLKNGGKLFSSFSVLVTFDRAPLESLRLRFTWYKCFEVFFFFFLYQKRRKILRSICSVDLSLSCLRLLQTRKSGKSTQTI